MAKLEPRAAARSDALEAAELPAWVVRVLGVGALALGVVAVVLGMTTDLLVRVPASSPASWLRLDEPVRPRLVWLPGGTFTMGTDDGERSERPAHEVTVSAFAMCETEVSLRQYELVMGARPSDCSFGCDDDHPVQNVSWDDAARYLNALTRLENRSRAAAGRQPLTSCYDESSWAWDRACTGYRLPTEAEWEYAARAGTTTGSSVDTFICRSANTAANLCDDGFSSLAPVVTPKLLANPWGLHGLHGNVWEWVFDHYTTGFYQRSAGHDPVNDEPSSLRVLRGGSFARGPEAALATTRNWYDATSRNGYDGFRCARGPHR